MRIKNIVLSTGMVCATLAGVLAAQPEVISSASRQQAAEVEDIGAIGEADASKGEYKSPVPEEPSKFRFNVGARAQYTSNAKLSGNHGSSDVIFFPEIEAGYKTQVGASKFTWDTVARVESGIYADNFSRTFLGYSVTSTLDYRFSPNAPRVFVSVEPYRYDGTDGQGLITEAIGTAVGTDWGYAFNNGNSLLFLGYTFTHHFSDPSIDTRNVNTATVGLSHAFTQQLIGQVYYQFNYDHYNDVDRRDFRHVVGLSLTYQLSKNWFTTLTGSFIDNDSDARAASYQAAGASLGINYQF